MEDLPRHAVALHTLPARPSSIACHPGTCQFCVPGLPGAGAASVILGQQPLLPGPRVRVDVRPARSAPVAPPARWLPRLLPSTLSSPPPPSSLSLLMAVALAPVLVASPSLGLWPAACWALVPACPALSELSHCLLRAPASRGAAYGWMGVSRLTEQGPGTAWHQRVWGLMFCGRPLPGARSLCPGLQTDSQSSPGRLPLLRP